MRCGSIDWGVRVRVRGAVGRLETRCVLMYLLLSLIPVDRAELHMVALLSKLGLAVGCHLVDEQDAWGRQLAL